MIDESKYPNRRLWGALLRDVFGTPAAIAAPLMVAIGFPTLAAVFGMMIQYSRLLVQLVPLIVGVQGGLDKTE